MAFGSAACGGRHVLPPTVLAMLRTTPMLALFLCLACNVYAADDALTTLSERSGFVKTGRYDETIDLCQRFEQTYPQAVRCFSFGTTPQGRPMQALAASRSGALTPQQAQAKGLPVLLIQGGIHAGEIDGKDAGFLALRQVLDGQAATGALEKVVVVFVPVFNVDGHENFRAWNRPNQRGPEEMGFRTTAQRYNLNRDYLKADAPEMQAMLSLVNAWDPIVEMDLHVTDGAQFQHDVSVTGEPVNSGEIELRKTGRAIRDGLLQALRAQGSDPVDFYPSFDKADDPASGFVHGVAPPRFSHGYFVLRNRVGILIETHSWKNYPTRVRITRNAVVGLIQLAARDGQRWLKAAATADARAQKLGGAVMPLSYKATEAVRMIDFNGYAYTRTQSDISGALMTRYDESKPQVWKIPLRDTIVPDLQVTLPRAGYLVPAEYARRVARQLDIHGVSYRKVNQPLIDVQAEVFHANKSEFSPQSVEGHQRISLQGQWRAERVWLVAGALFVPINQPKAQLLANVLEPQAPDSLAAWGEFNNAFEQKEYMEDYVAEDAARDLLAREPRLKTEFEQRLTNDSAFAKDPAARLDFFYREHPAYDPAYNRYPIVRVDAAP